MPGLVLCSVCPGWRFILFVQFLVSTTLADVTLNLTDQVIIARLAGSQSLVSPGTTTGPYVLLNTKSGLCIQPAAPSTANQELDLTQPSNNGSLVLLSSGCNGSNPDAYFEFTSAGQLLHYTTALCVSVSTVNGAKQPTPSAVLADCKTNSSDNGSAAMLWTVTAQASLQHRLSGMCIAPMGGQPAPGAALHLQRECDNEHVEYMPVRPDKVAVWLEPQPAQEQLEPRSGRKQSILPAPLCCTGDNCSYKPYMQRRNTFLTTARSSKYVQAVKGLACSLAKSNPGSHLIIMGTASDTQSLTAAELDYLKHNASLPGLDVEYKTVNDIDFPNHENKRFHLNWVKLQAWNLSEWDAIIMLDADMTAVGDLKHLFRLPHHYASVPEQAPNFPYNSGGFKFLRPCPAIFEHMLLLLLRHPQLQFRNTFSEQSFLDWYFRYDTLSLPFQYNANAHQHPDLATQGTVTGLQPTLVHFADKKPWEVPTDDPLHKYANPCSSEFPVLKPVQRSMPAHARERRKSRRRRRHSFPSIWHI